MLAAQPSILPLRPGAVWKANSRFAANPQPCISGRNLACARGSLPYVFVYVKESVCIRSVVVLAVGQERYVRKLVRIRVAPEANGVDSHVVLPRIDRARNRVSRCALAIREKHCNPHSFGISAPCRD